MVSHQERPSRPLAGGAGNSLGRIPIQGRLSRLLYPVNSSQRRLHRTDIVCKAEDNGGNMSVFRSHACC
ncbi:hypothetical protein NY78_1650 [Desulfovibrio sp. TomC]|nr:hypothetical protein NY78_1650 [Desulfovibrio sp. TomC]